MLKIRQLRQYLSLNAFWSDIKGAAPTPLQLLDSPNKKVLDNKL
jgi:hypothetical protein